MDWYPILLSWQLSVTLDVSFCLAALNGRKIGHPEIFNSDQGSQFTSAEFTGRLNHHAAWMGFDRRDCGGRSNTKRYTSKITSRCVRSHRDPEELLSILQWVADSRRTRLLQAGRDLLPSRGRSRLGRHSVSSGYGRWFAKKRNRAADAIHDSQFGKAGGLVVELIFSIGGLR